MTIRRNHTGHRCGSDHPKAKLTEEKVKAMRADYVAGKGGYGTLAKLYQCGASTARDICTYRTRWQA
jgi:hypothetical protein